MEYSQILTPVLILDGTCIFTVAYIRAQRTVTCFLLTNHSNNDHMTYDLTLTMNISWVIHTLENWLRCIKTLQNALHNSNVIQLSLKPNSDLNANPNAL